MKTVTAAEANRQFSKLLREVRAGETVLVTWHGEPVATIAPANATSAARAKAKRRPWKICARSLPSTCPASLATSFMASDARCAQHEILVDAHGIN
jgi:prevent-host-death family protein